MTIDTSSARDSNAQAGWRFGLWWTIANAAGWSVGLALGFAIVGRFSEIIGHALSPLSADLGLSLVGAMVGTMTIPVGILQWIVLRRQIDHAGRWVLASTVGWIIGLALGWSASMALRESSDALHSAAMGAITGGIGGAVSGTMQWLVSWQEEDMPGLWWLPASILGWGAAFASAWSTAWLISMFVNLVAIYAVIGIIVGGVGGAITGIALIWFLRRPADASPMATSA